MPFTIVKSSFDTISKQLSTIKSSYSVFTLVFTKVKFSYKSFARKSTTQKLGSFNSFFKTARFIYAREADTGSVSFLGELSDGATTLTDVGLSDGFYEVEVRSSENLYNQTRSRVRFSVEIAGGVIASQDTPSVQELTFEITQGFSTRLRWAIADTVFTPGLKFGIWRSATTPVDVSGSPDFETLAYEGLGRYSFLVQQTANEYFAVAAINGVDQGQELEVLSPWDLTPLSPPPNQHGYRSSLL